MLKIVIVGGGLAGHRAATEIRKLSSEVSITLIGAEAGLPYDRPPLSKDFLLGRIQAQQIILQNAPNYTELGIDHRSQTLVTSIDRKECKILTADGEAIVYDRLLLATGSRPRRLPADIDSPKIHYLRTLSDAVALREELKPNRKIAIVGGGFIGLEVAAVARARGCEVTVVEARDRILSRSIPPIVSNAMRTLHETNGVKFLLNRTVRACRHHSFDSFVLELNSGEIEADVIIVGIGIIPNTDLAENAGLALADGIVVDSCCRTLDKKIFAAGEVTAHPDNTGRLRRLESWKVASDQPIVAARSMLGQIQEYNSPPWLWSDQFDVNLQVVGTLDDAVAYCIKGEIGSRSWLDLIVVTGLSEPWR